MTATYNQDDDLRLAIDNNGLDGDFKEDDIKEIVAEVPGANDEFDWHWVVSLHDGRFAYLYGGCDYTGWDCQSFLTVVGTYPTALDAADAAVEKEKYSDRLIRQNLRDQITLKQPKYSY